MDVIADLQGDVGPGPRNNVVWFVAGRRDRRRHRVRPGGLSFRATDAQSRKAWHETLRLIRERNPRIVVARTQEPPRASRHAGRVRLQPGLPHRVRGGLAASRNAGELIAAMKQQVPPGGSGPDTALFTAARFFRGSAAHDHAPAHLRQAGRCWSGTMCRVHAWLRIPTCSCGRSPLDDAISICTSQPAPGRGGECYPVRSRSAMKRWMVTDAGTMAGVVPGDAVVVSFQLSCGRCENCRRGFTNACSAYPRARPTGRSLRPEPTSAAHRRTHVRPIRRSHAGQSAGRRRSTGHGQHR